MNADQTVKAVHDIHCRRDFINLPFCHSDASIYSMIRIWEMLDGKTELSSEMKVRDCDKTVNLIFNVGDEERLSNSLFKVDALITHLNDFREALIAADELNKKILLKEIL